MKKNRKIVSSFFTFVLIFSIFTLFAKGETSENLIKVTNTSELNRIQTPVEIILPPQYSKGENIKILELDRSTELPLKRFDDTNLILMTQLDIKKGEEKELLIEKGFPKINCLTPNASIGTDYAFVNYKRALVISTSEKNRIEVSTKDAKVIDKFELGKGKLREIRSEKPQFMVLKAEKPIFVYESTLSDHSKTSLIEPGDSDTTTLYGSDLYIYTERHLWLSSYKETEFKLYDENNIEVYFKVLQKNSGFFIDNLDSGVYHLLADNPLTVQFGYLDDENFSLIYGETNTINGFAFGDLIIESKYPDTSVEINYGNTKKKIKLRGANDYEVVHVITEFSQRMPESTFFSVVFSKPVVIATFSSGNNFGGEFIPGDNGLFLDRTFNFITGRISKEFSKEQKNIISIMGVEDETEVTVDKAIKSRAILDRFTDFYLESVVSNGSVSIKSNKRTLVNHLRNYKDKGLFYFVPPIKDNSLTIGFIITPVNRNSTTTIITDTNFETISLLRIRDFFVNITSTDYLVFTILFLVLIVLCTSGIIICFIVSHLSMRRVAKEISESEIQRSQTKEKEGEEKKFLTEGIVEVKKGERFFEVNFPLKKSIFDEIKDKKLVLDPGSANRLYAEGLLSEFSVLYVCKSSTKKLTEEVSKFLKTVDLNRQDIERARVISEKLSTTEEAGKAIVLARKISANAYVTSYRLPNKVYNLNIIRVTDALKDL